MTSRRWLALAAGLVLVGTGAALLPPRRFVVAGTSMAPGLLPGDVVATGLLPLRDRLTRPRRFERWVLDAADGTPVIKRIAGLPGETVVIAAGDLVVADRIVLKGPRQLAAMGQRVSAGHDDAAAGGERWARPATDVLDDEPLATGGGSLLLPVRDGGVAAVVQASRPPDDAGLRVRARVAETVFTWRLRAAGRYAIVAGRLDGHVVAVAWRLPADAADPCPERSCLPVGPPDRWSFARPWPDRDEGDVAPALAVVIEPATTVAQAGAAIERAWRWRDVLQRGAPDGAAAWSLGPNAVFVLGDFPAGSRDSRHWGPLPVDALRHRIP